MENALYHFQQNTRNIETSLEFVFHSNHRQVIYIIIDFLIRIPSADPLDHDVMRVQHCYNNPVFNWTLAQEIEFFDESGAIVIPKPLNQLLLGYHSRTLDYAFLQLHLPIKGDSSDISNMYLSYI